MTLKIHFKNIVKRDGRIVPFDASRIVIAISKAMKATQEGNLDKDPDKVGERALKELIKKYPASHTPHIEEIQDAVEESLILMDFPKTAKAYILYRAERAKVREEMRQALSQEVREQIKESSKYFETPYQEFIFYQFYARWRDDLGRRETWVETIDRYIDFMKEQIGEKLSDDEYEEVRQAMLNREICPSMRLLWSAGKACRQSNVTSYNCSFIAPRTWRDLSEIMYLSMCGAGVGFSVEPENVEKFPQIQKQNGKKAKPIVVEDSKVGWCNAFVEACTAWEKGYDVDIDYSKVRPAGARLKTMGGRASGPAPLEELMKFTRRKILAKQNRRLTAIDLHDIICQIGLIVVAGGVRRSALISLSALDDADMRDAKKGTFWQTEGQRSMANNSAVYETKPTAQEFMDEWTALVKAKSGERGIFNRGGLEKQVPQRRWEKLKDAIQPGVNPCVTDDTWIMTSDGARPVKDLISRTFEAVVNGKTYNSKGFFATGEKEVFEIKTNRGFIFRATANHKVLTIKYKSPKKQINEWKEVSQLALGDKIVLHKHSDFEWGGLGSETEGWLLGNLIGDGNIEKSGKANLDYWGVNREFMTQRAVALVHSTVPARSDMVGHVAKSGYARISSLGLGILASSYGITHESKNVNDAIEQTSSQFYKGFLRGWFDADGSVQGNQLKGVSIRLNSSSLDNLQRAQRMLARMGVIGTIYENRRSEGPRLMPDGRGGLKQYICLSNHELVITGSSISTFQERVGFSDPDKAFKLQDLLSKYRRELNREKYYSEVVEVKPAGVLPVYDCQIPDVHAFDGNGIYLHNCGEIYLQSKQFCNLTSIVVRPKDDTDSLKRKMRLATLLGTYQATLTNFEYLSKKWKENCEDEQLLGVSITGYYDNALVRSDEMLEQLRQEAIETNKTYAKRFGKNPSTAITCVKPHGNSGQLLGVGSGMHPWFSPYFIRRVRISATDPLLKLARDQGVMVKFEIGYSTSNASTMVLEFPIKAPKGAITVKDVSALDMLKEWKRLKLHFTEHNPSATIYIADNEWIAVANFIYENWDIIGGLSFLPRTDHVYPLAPYEEITKEQYEELASNIPELDFSQLVLYEKEDETTGSKELACAGGVCEVDLALEESGAPSIAPSAASASK